MRGRNWSGHPFVVTITVLAGLISIIVFVTGKPNLSETVHGKRDIAVDPPCMEKPYYSTSGQDEKCQYEWIYKKAMLGNASDLFQLGNWWGYRDHERALVWFKKAAIAGDDFAMYHVGIYYEMGWGVPRDCNEAKQWFMKAAAKGEPQSQFNLDHWSCQ